MIKNVFVVFIIFFLGSCTQNKVVGPWDLNVLFEAPEWVEADTALQPGMKAILYESIDYDTKPVQVFAYYSAPAGSVPEGGWPAVVCVHGGGGTAFHEWVQNWNDHGFAAISMDLEGHYPLRKPGERRGPRLSTPKPGPTRVGVFGDYKETIEKQWYYHAVSQAILAHSLIRSFPEVNPEKIGVTGISWGGTLTSTLMGVDDRFAFAIPVYGCGFLPESDGHQGETIKPGLQTEVVNQYYDGSAYFSNVNIPTLWVNGTNDKHFPIPATQESSRAVYGPATLRIELRMRHGHYPGWEPEEIYAFAKSVVEDGEPLMQFESPKIKGDVVSVLFNTSKELKNTSLLCTADTGVWNQRRWKELEATVNDNVISSFLPDSATAVYFNAIDQDDLMVSSSFIEVE
ncbi:alpha/beta hydrolase family protein [Bacteroidota bacterium]